MEQNNVKSRLSAMNGLSQTDSSTQFLQQQQELASSFGGGGGGGRKIQNMSMQTGEEFSMEFLQDRFTTRGNRLVPNKSSTYDKRGSFDSDISYHMGCEDVARVITLKRMDSDVSTSSMGSPNGSENACFLDKLTWISGEEHHRSRNGFGELNNDRGPSLGSTFYGLESPRGNNMNGHLLNMSDRLQPGKMKLICSSGGKILPRPGDGKLRYVGGETRIISISKSISWIELVRKTSCICSQPHYIKYQLPGEDLDGLISVSSDEDLQNMMEEHYGLENLGGSPRLRIFLIPMGESENLSSFEVTQTYPDYHYVVAVNGIGDPSPRIIPTAGDASTRFNCNPSFCKRVTPSMVPLEINGGLNSFQNMRSPYPSPPISPVPLPGDSLATESSTTSLLTVPLSTDNTGLNSIVFHQTLQGKPTLTNCRHICKHVEGGQLEESSIEQYHNFLLNKDLVGLSGNYNFDGCYNERPIQRRHFHSESPISHPKDSRSVVGSTDSSDPPQGIPHAYSDSKLHQHGEQMSTYYCSQEAESPSLELKFSKAHVSPFLSSSPRREKPLQVCETCHTTVRIVDGNYQVPNLSNEASLGLETSSQNDPFVQQSKMSYWEKPPIDCKRKIQIEPISLSGNVSSRIITTPIDGFDTIADFKYPINKLENFTNYQLESAPSDVVMMSEKTASDQLSPLCIKVNIKQEGDISRVKNTEFELLENASLHHNIDSSLHDLVRQPSNNTYYLKGNLVQPVESERDMCSSEHPHTRSVDSFTCILDDNLAPKVNFCENDLHTTPRNVDYEEQIRLLDDEEGKRRAQNVGKLSCGEPTNERSDIEDILLVQTRNSIEEQKRSTILKPLVVMKDVTSVDPSSILVSCADSSKFTVPTSGGTASATLTKLENVIPIPQVRLVVAKQTMPDFVPPTTIKLETVVQEYEFGDTKHNSGNKYGCISDVAVAEMEASIHGLQIIKNSDLEELRELGAGTYGIAYHGKWRGTDVAIKRIKKSCFSGRSSEQEQLTKDFWREAHILSTLHHPNVVAFYGIVPDGAGGTLATVTEFMVNGSLRNALLRKERCLDRRKKLMIAMDAAFGMEYLHSKSIVHFDLKCENLLVNLRDPQRPICKVGDFGLSRIKQNTLVSGGVRGTLPWMAPELLNGSNSQVSEKVDVFAFGMSMWEILTGEEPYADMHCGAIIGGIVKNTLRPPVPEDCDQDWRELMEQCWSLNPDSRPSFTEIANRLRVMSMTLLAKGSKNQTRQSKSSS